MGKKQVVSIENKQRKEVALAKLKKELGDGYACFVLLTCTEPSSDGHMEVEMDFEGDETLASFLVENAAQIFEERNITRESK